ncbi:recombinase family protein [Siccirubricoccus sp. KC 17139]|uniref:Recombinase family protein n=1 Tax=Siccirubricoccus soli TaxID=2899147 RepID=A0ABT1CZP5_9PROT|nr:recombinase family protein [Siccirubricoccus soli]MCO6415138.1 recombinase family protein [Siccirubricoccus soli]MCP2681269.1 recombinase family protein [Siccirubricoccus soli]
MATGRFVSYLRVSTDKQGRSGLGLEAQREAVAAFLNGGAWTLQAEYVETESGKRSDRPDLAKALAHCRLTGATLVVAKLDRLARNQAFLMSVYEGSGEGGVVFCDLPNVPAGPVGKFLVQQMAAVAELEAGLISARTKAALQAAKARGKVLGRKPGTPGYLPDAEAGAAAVKAKADSFAAVVAPIAQQLRDEGQSLRQIADALAARGIRTARGGAWTATAVKNVLARQQAAA